MVSLEFATATRILFGAGRIAGAPGKIAALGVRRVLLAAGRSPDRSAPLAASMGALGIAAVPFRVPGEPTVDLARQGTALARAEGRHSRYLQRRASAVPRISNSPSP